MSLLDRIHEANRHDFRGFVPWFIAGTRVGCVREGFAESLRQWPDVFRYDGHTLELTAQLDHAGEAERTAALGAVCADLRDAGLVPGWRDERYPVSVAWGQAPLLQMERAAVPLFGVTAYGVHINGFVDTDDDERRMWVARRSLAKPTGPGKLDQVVAGGQPHGIGLLDNVIKECAEEAGIPRALAARARPVGAISYLLETPQGMRPDVIFNFDLELPADFEPENADGEVDAFYLWPLWRVHDTLADTDAFKFNCALVAIDFLIRHGHIDSDQVHYQSLALGLRRDINAVPASWRRRS